MNNNKDIQNELKAIKLQKHTEDYKKAKETLKTAFPKWEQSPFWALSFMSKHPGVDFLTWHDSNDNYIGVSYSIHENNKLMILYLAIDESARNQGYGTKIINILQTKDNITETVLDIESPYQQTENHIQREKRLNFYKKLGFISSEMEIIEQACNYLILGTNNNKEESVETYKNLTAKLTSNLCHLNIMPVKI